MPKTRKTPTETARTNVCWTPEVALAAANMAEQAAGKIAAAIVLLNAVEDGDDLDGWTLDAAIQLLAGVRTDLLASIADAPAKPEEVRL